jgi:hypothetical protein
VTFEPGSKHPTFGVSVFEHCRSLKWPLKLRYDTCNAW